MARRSVFCIFPSRAQAQRVFSGLSALEFLAADISVLFQTISADEMNISSEGKPALTCEAPEKAAFIAGHKLNQMASIEAVVIRGSGSLFSAAGPLAAIVAATKPADIAGALINFGVPSTEADFYERRVKEGQVFLSVRSENPEMTDRAKKFFVAEGAENIRTLMDVPKSENVRKREYGRSRVFLR